MSKLKKGKKIYNKLHKGKLTIDSKLYKRSFFQVHQRMSKMINDMKFFIKPKIRVDFHNENLYLRFAHYEEKTGPDSYIYDYYGVGLTINLITDDFYIAEENICKDISTEQALYYTQHTVIEEIRYTFWYILNDIGIMIKK